MVRRTTGLTALVAVICVTLLSGSCGGADPPVVQKATAFLGGALSGFGGTDGADPAARATARDIAVSRSYDFTPAGFTVADGAAVSTGLAASGYGDGAGTVVVVLTEGEVDLAIDSETAGITNVAMSGEFSATAAQQAVDSPGASFDVSWTITWDLGGESFEVTAHQILSGSDWVTI